MDRGQMAKSPRSATPLSQNLTISLSGIEVRTMASNSALRSCERCSCALKNGLSRLGGTVFTLGALFGSAVIVRLQCYTKHEPVSERAASG